MSAFHRTLLLALLLASAGNASDASTRIKLGTVVCILVLGLALQVKLYRERKANATLQMHRKAGDGKEEGAGEEDDNEEDDDDNDDDDDYEGCRGQGAAKGSTSEI